ncbi:Copiatype Polyprotein [Phytophthora palmivora]|uniref:Copiatype Polyprotein n=1 Tax=Phytophthora palmivora TaxID=4796 RepID=A0A2P4YDH6_9STRA|nr:Copiatype Polyprotein [Phytophthora palmivora]
MDYINQELNGFENKLTEPCLHVYSKDSVFALILLYVDDVVFATNSERFKTSPFDAINKKYGFRTEAYFTIFSVYK